MTTLIPKYTQVNTSNRTMAEKFADVKSVKDYGAVGDGVTDDTVAIQAALNSGATYITFPPATYIFTRLTIPNNVTVVGNNAILKLKANSNGGPSYYAVTQQATVASNITITGLIFDGNKANQLNSGANNFSVYWINGLTFTNGSNITLKELTFYDWTAEGLSFRGCTSSLVDTITAYNNATVGVRIGAVANPIVQYCTISNIVSYDNSSIGNTGYDGMFIETCRNCTFTNLNTHYQTADLFEGGSGIKLVTVLDCTFSNLNCNNNQWQGLHLVDSRRNTFTSVVASNNGRAAFAGTGSGILLVELSTDNVFAGATMSSNLAFGVMVFDENCIDNTFNSCNVLANPIGIETRASGTTFFSSLFKGNTTQIQLTKQAATDPTNFKISNNTIVLGTNDFIFQNSSASVIKSTSLIGANTSTSTNKNDVFIAGSLNSPWANVGGANPVASFYTDNIGNVTLKGLVNSGSVGTSIFTLPLGYRPTTVVYYSVFCSTGYGVITVNTDGTVVATTFPGGNISLTGIVFSVLIS